MGHYRNFDLATYFIAQAALHATEEKLEKDIAFFQKYMQLDKVYLEPFRGCFAGHEKITLCKNILEKHGIKVSGGLTTVIPTPEGDEPKSRIFGTFCYNDEKMLSELKQVSRFLGEHFDEFIIDDFYFTGCTCDACRAEKEKYNAAHHITDGSWQAYRCDLMRRVSLEYVIGPAKAVNPDINIIIKYPNWAESYQQTGYAPAQEREIFDMVYTGTETRDPVSTDQHLPRYLSYSLITYFDAMCPGRNGGGWFDPFDMHITEHYLEQAYLTAFAGAKELMLFCFQALVGRMQIPALGFQLERLDRVMDHAGRPCGIYCYLPDNCRGEDNAQDYLGMVGLPVLCTPYFPENAECILLTRSAAYDRDVVQKLEKYLAGGGKAIVTTGFYAAAEEMGIHALSSVRMQGRKMLCRDYLVEEKNRHGRVLNHPAAREQVLFSVPEFSNNASWALIKGVSGQESCGILLRDFYGKGTLYTLSLPDVFSALYTLPCSVLSRLRAEFAVRGLWLEGGSEVSLFVYDNDTFIPYAYVDEGAQPVDVLVHASADQAELENPVTGQKILPLYRTEQETVFPMRLSPGEYGIWKVKKA